MTHDKTLEGLKACVLAAEGAEDLEYYVTLMRLQEEGVAVDTVALSMDSFAGKNGLKITPDLTIDEAAGIAYDVVVLPGGWAPDKLRRSEPVLELIRNRYEAGAVVAAICHGPWLMISAGLVQGRRRLLRGASDAAPALCRPLDPLRGAHARRFRVVRHLHLRTL